MKVYGVNAEVRAFIESRARKGDGDAQAALDELNRTNNGCEPQLAVMDGELCIGQMMSMFNAKAPKIEVKLPPGHYGLNAQHPINDVLIKEKIIEADKPDPAVEEMPKILAKKVSTDFDDDKQVKGVIENTQFSLGALVLEAKKGWVDDDQVQGLKAKEPVVSVDPPFLVDDNQITGVKAKEAALTKTRFPWLIAAGILLVWSFS